MSDPTPPAVSEAMREAVARDIADILLNGGAISPAAFARYLGRAGGPIASEIARLTGERDAARGISQQDQDLIDRTIALIRKQQEWQVYGERLEKSANAAMADEIALQRRTVNELRAALSRLQADREAEVAKLKTACDHYEKALSHLWDGGSVLATDELAAARKAHRAALTETPDA